MRAVGPGWPRRRPTGTKAVRAAAASPASKPVAGLLVAPMRWHTQDRAVYGHAAVASKIAASISLPFRQGPGRCRYPHP